jgi:hypothetical protein
VNGVEIAAPLSLIIAQAAEHDALLVEAHPDDATFDLTITLVDGRRIERRILVIAFGDELSVSEPVPDHLPTHCPGRHINSDASFCLGWSGHEEKAVIDSDSARLWWARMLQFWRLQERAARRRQWPDRRQWAHGGAAKHQQAAEVAAAKLGKSYVTALEWRRLSVSSAVERGSANGPAYNLMLADQPILRVWRDHPRLVNMRQPCICDGSAKHRAVAMRGCGDHAQAGIDLVRSLLRWREEEQAFWAELKGATCCGTLDNCPIRHMRGRTSDGGEVGPDIIERKVA